MIEDDADQLPALPEEPTLLEDDVERAPIWMVSFGDVTALMLTFFVMLFSMSHLQSETWDAIVALISTRETPAEDVKPKPISDRNIASVSLYNALPTDYLARILREKLARDEILKDAPVTGLDEHVVISVPADRIFSGGGVALQDTANETMQRLSGVLLQFGNQVDIQGHTTPDPPVPGSGGRDGARYDTNWGLSLARAVIVARTISDAGYTGRLTALGLGASRYRHLDSRLSEIERYRLANRIDIVILPEAGGQ